MKRFWRDCAVVAAQRGGGPSGGTWTLSLDGKPPPTGEAGLRMGTRALAEAVAGEWRAGRPGDVLDPGAMRLTALALGSGRMARDPAPTRAALLRYAGTDLLCYRAIDPVLAARQAVGWQPWLDWAADGLQAPLAVTDALWPIAQPEAGLRALGQALEATDPDELAMLSVAVPALGSLVLGLALARGALPPAEANRLAHLDEAHQAERWGRDPDLEAKREATERDLEAAARFLALARGGPGSEFSPRPA